MNFDRIIHSRIVAASLVLFPMTLPIGSLGAQPEEQTETFSEKQVQGLKHIAVDSVEDSLKACLNRIPADSSPGQIKMAEQTCNQVEAERNEIRLTF